MTREELRTQTLNLFKDNKSIALQWGTSVGKSRAAIDMINYYKEHINSGSVTTVLLLVAEIAHKDNWYKEFNKWDFDFLGVDITVECYASLKNYTNTSWDLCIMDEAHHIGSDLRLGMLYSIKAHKYILLSATLSKELIYNLTPIIGKICTSKVPLQMAIVNNWVSEPKIFLIPLTLDNTISNQEIIEEWGRKDKRRTIKCSYENRWTYLKGKKDIYPNVTLIISCTQRQKYNYISEKIEFYKKKFFLTRNELFKNMWLQYGSQRKRFLGDSKTNSIPLLTDTFGDKRYICFCSSIEQANYLGGENAIHSNNPNRLELLNKFNNKEISNLYAVGMLVEGVNLSDIEIGVITQLDGQERVYTQKFGRVLRSEDPIQYIFYYKNTRDEEYLNKVLKGIDEQYIKEINI